MKTINLKGKKYAQVSERLKAVHIENKKVEIKTFLNWIGEKGSVSIEAVVETDKGVYTAHSFWLGTKEKAIEKLETVAVWRALAFAWYLADGEIASYEEVKDYLEEKEKKETGKKEEKNTDVENKNLVWEFTKVLKEAEPKSKEELNEIVKSFYQENRNKINEATKEKLANIKKFYIDKKMKKWQN